MSRPTKQKSSQRSSGMGLAFTCFPSFIIPTALRKQNRDIEEGATVRDQLPQEISEPASCLGGLWDFSDKSSTCASALDSYGETLLHYSTQGTASEGSGIRHDATSSAVDMRAGDSSGSSKGICEELGEEMLGAVHAELMPDEYDMVHDSQKQHHTQPMLATCNAAHSAWPPLMGHRQPRHQAADMLLGTSAVHGDETRQDDDDVDLATVRFTRWMAEQKGQEAAEDLLTTYGTAAAAAVAAGRWQSQQVPRTMAYNARPGVLPRSMSCPQVMRLRRQLQATLKPRSSFGSSMHALPTVLEECDEPSSCHGSA
uniref:Uncharacterized protein n=1 Tax=Chlamydomonas leiostraca TaxID=1034604 RepID=A0A7S0WZS1_9CHLO|mmetsp:Transcript_4028/g.10032  ORF Transcript_4028/g.10032 Transcript_4028/m.10032 type:complete len:313 (+) Transcript_4028:144-1082(+)